MSSKYEITLYKRAGAWHFRTPFPQLARGYSSKLAAKGAAEEHVRQNAKTDVETYEYEV